MRASLSYGRANKKQGWASWPAYPAKREFSGAIEILREGFTASCVAG